MSVIVPVNLVGVAPPGQAHGQLEVVGRTVCIIRPGPLGVRRGADRQRTTWFVGPAQDLRATNAIPDWLQRRVPRDQPDLHYLAVRVEDAKDPLYHDWWLFAGSEELVKRADAALGGAVTSVLHDPKSTGSTPVSPHSLLVAAAVLAAIGVILEILTLT